MLKAICIDDFTPIIIEEFCFKAIVCDTLKADKSEDFSEGLFTSNAFVDVCMKFVSIDAIEELLFNS